MPTALAKEYSLYSLSSLSVSHPGPSPSFIIYYLPTMIQQRSQRFAMMPCKEDYALLRLELPVRVRIVFVKQLGYFHSVFGLYPVDGEEERPQQASKRARFAGGG